MVRGRWSVVGQWLGSGLGLGLGSGWVRPVHACRPHVLRVSPVQSGVLTTDYVLLTTGCLLLTAYYLLVTTHYSQLTTRYSLTHFKTECVYMRTMCLQHRGCPTPTHPSYICGPCAPWVGVWY